jgi:hypothetical protein
LRQRLTYANVVSTAALFLAVVGGTAYAASKIGTSEIQRHAVIDKKLASDSVKNGKLVDAAVGNAEVKDDSIEPSKLTFPVFYVASPTGGSQNVTGSQAPYPIADNRWTQGPDQLNFIFGQATGTLAYDGSGSGSCEVFFDIRLDGQKGGGVQIGTGSTTPEQVTQTLGIQPEIGPESPVQHELTAQVGSNGDCEPGSTIDSTRIKVLDIG